MTLAAIVGVCLLTAWPSVPARAAQFALAAAVPQESTSKPPASAEPGESNTKISPTEQTTPSASSSQCKNSSGTAKTQEQRKKGPAAPSKPTKPKNKSGHASKAKKQHDKPPTEADKPSAPPKVVVKDGGATDPTITISPGLNQQQASRQRQSAEELLAKADENLKKISGQDLNPTQQELVKQIQQYMEQAKTAGNTGDLTRQRNLALKAQLLSEELVKP